MSKLDKNIKKYEFYKFCKLLFLVSGPVIGLYSIWLALHRKNIPSMEVTLLLLFIILYFFLIKRYPSLADITLKKILSEDCNASLWLEYFNRKKMKKNSYVYNIGYANALNLVGDFSKSKNELDKVAENKLTIPLLVSYLNVQNDYYFFLKDLSKLYDVQTKLKNLNNKNEQVNRILQSIRQINTVYIATLENDSKNLLRLEDIKRSSDTMLKKMKLSYALYLFLLANQQDKQAALVGEYIQNNGGTLFFVDEIKNKINLKK